MMKGRIAPGRNLVVDAGGRGHSNLRLDDIQDPAFRDWIAPTWPGSEPMTVARQAQRYGKFDTVTFKNMIDDGPYGKTGEPGEIYAVLNKSKRRASTAAFDPSKSDSSDLLAAVPLAAGAGLAATQQKKKRKGYADPISVLN